MTDVHMIASHHQALGLPAMQRVLGAIGDKCDAILTNPAGVAVRVDGEPLVILNKDKKPDEAGFVMTLWPQEPIEHLLLAMETILVDNHMPCIIDWEVKGGTVGGTVGEVKE